MLVNTDKWLQREHSNDNVNSTALKAIKAVGLTHTSTKMVLGLKQLTLRDILMERASCVLLTLNTALYEGTTIAIATTQDWQTQAYTLSRTSVLKLSGVKFGGQEIAAQ